MPRATKNYKMVSWLLALMAVLSFFALSEARMQIPYFEAKDISDALEKRQTTTSTITDTATVTSFSETTSIVTATSCNNGGSCSQWTSTTTLTSTTSYTPPCTTLPIPVPVSGASGMDSALFLAMCTVSISIASFIGFAITAW
ncbi:hypothetical protein ABW20_dc0110069 [Dactylellina cionopaga]|nr:hypothetical protein ABW20_dc0110069 [Dactylellina cionopaga]